MSRRRLTWALVALSLTFYGRGGAEQSRTRVELDFDEWAAAVRQHVPTREDSHLSTIALWPWSRLKPVLEYASWKSGDIALLLRAAVLHAEIGFSIPIDERATEGVGSVILAIDGQRVGGSSLDPHLWWGRRLLDRFSPKHPQWKQAEPLVIGWYRAVAAVLAHRTWFADLDAHLRRGLERFPDDAELLFDAGCMNEALATPAILAAMPGLPRRTTLPAAHQELGSPQRRLYQAEEHFARASDRDPSFAEARVRLARVQYLRGRLQPAIAQYQKAAALESGDIVRYYNAMFLGRALATAGNSAGARKSYEAAVGLFPQAPAPRIGLAHLAARGGEPAAARSFVETVLARPGEEERLQDPLWVYHLCAGREPAERYHRFVAALPPLQ
jgi:tetratricopeptide (TPR) repeat protein